MAVTCAACEQQGIVPKATAIEKGPTKQSCNFDSQGLKTSERYRTPASPVGSAVGFELYAVRGTSDVLPILLANRVQFLILA